MRTMENQLFQQQRKLVFYEFFLHAFSTSLLYSLLLFLSIPIFIAVLQHHHHICRRGPVHI